MLTHTTPFTWLQFANLARQPVYHSVSTRHGGVSSAPYASLNLGMSVGDNAENVQTNRSRFAALGNYAVSQLITLHQMHSTKVTVVTTATPHQQGDAMISHHTDLLLTILAADCASLLLYDPVTHAIGAVHAGWRGAVGGILPATITAMARTYDTKPSDLILGIGPCIHVPSYPISPERAEQAAAAHAVVMKEERQHFLDIPATLFRQAIAAGIPQDQIEQADLNTFERTDLFYSHRAEQLTGRFAAAISLKARQ